MSDLQNQTPADTYKGLLQVGDYTNGVDANSEYVQDGEGTNSALSISTTKVGVGTVSPSAELDVNGNVVADEYALDQTGSSSSAVAIHAPATNELAIRTNSTEAMRITSAGNVGIGTTSPDAALHISTHSPSIRLTDTTPATDTASQVWADSDAVGALFLAADITNVGTDPFISFRVAGLAQASEKMRITSSGDVGIGTTSPSSKLEITDSVNHLNLKVPNTISQSVMKFSDSAGLGATINYDHNTDKLHFITDGTATPDNGALNIDSTGNIGIGTTSFGLSSVGVIGIANATAPTSSPADMVQLYAEDIASSSELRVRDEAGNVTTLSPHAKDAPDSLYDNGKGVDEMHRVANHYLGTIIFTNVDRRNDLLQKQLNGEELPEDRTFTVTETFAQYNARTGADLQVEDWDANQQAIFDAQEEKVVARQAEIDAWDNEEEEAPEPLESYVKKPKPDWLT